MTEFDFCILQLLLSIVGDKEKRKQTLSAAYEYLRSGGYVYLSCSGTSDKINPNYKQLYEQDYPATGEMYTYFSRDGNGNVLYATHHFSSTELRVLMEDAGFCDVAVHEIREASSRRPEEVANFLYAVGRKP